MQAGLRQYRQEVVAMEFAARRLPKLAQNLHNLQARDAAVHDHAVAGAALHQQFVAGGAHVEKPSESLQSTDGASASQ
jgi:hypothetical protein